MTEFLFRWNYPKPGDEDEHQLWCQDLLESGKWPTKEEVEDDSFQILLLPMHWRRKPYQACDTMNDFWKVRAREEWAADKKQAKEANKRKERTWNYKTNYNYDTGGWKSEWDDDRRAWKSDWDKDQSWKRDDWDKDQSWKKYWS